MRSDHRWFPTTSHWQQLTRSRSKGCCLHENLEILAQLLERDRVHPLARVILHDRSTLEVPPPVPIYPTLGLYPYYRHTVNLSQPQSIPEFVEPFSSPTDYRFLQDRLDILGDKLIFIPCPRDFFALGNGCHVFRLSSFSLSLSPCIGAAAVSLMPYKHSWEFGSAKGWFESFLVGWLVGRLVGRRGAWGLREIGYSYYYHRQPYSKGSRALVLWQERL